MISNVLLHFANFIVYPLHKLLQVVVAWLQFALYSKSELLGADGMYIVPQLLEDLLVYLEHSGVIPVDVT